MSLSRSISVPTSSTFCDEAEKLPRTKPLCCMNLTYCFPPPPPPCNQFIPFHSKFARAMILLHPAGFSSPRKGAGEQSLKLQMC